MEIACSGFIYGLTVAASMVRTGVFKRVLLIGAEELSRLVELRGPRHRGAVRRRRRRGRARSERRPTRFSPASSAPTARNPADLYLPVSGTADPPITAEDITLKRNTISMDGKEVFRFAVTKMIDATQHRARRAPGSRRATCRG